MKEYWVRNTTTSDIILHDLRVTIPANKVANLLQRRPSLTMEQINASKANGKLSICFGFRPPKLIELPAAPTFSQSAAATEIKESTSPVPSRVKTSVVINPKDKDYVEVMDEENIRMSEVSAVRYANYAEGIADPLSVDSENSTFKVVSVKSNLDVMPESPEVPNPAKATGKIRRNGKSKGATLTVDASE